MAQKTTITLEKYTCDEGKYFCNREQRIIATQLFLSEKDSLDNWPEIDESEKAEIEAQWEEERKAEEEKMEQEGQDAQNA